MARTGSELVRCLECGTKYRLEPHDGEAGPCPHCGGVGWIAVDTSGPPPPTEKTS